MNLVTKITRLKDLIREQASAQMTLDGTSLSKARQPGEPFPIFWFEIETPAGEHIPFRYCAMASGAAAVRTIGQGMLIPEGEGFKIYGLLTTQPLEALSPEEAAGLLLARLNELSGLTIEQATLKMTGHQ